MLTERTQNETEANKITCILETEELQSCNRSKEITDYKNITDKEIKNLYNYSSGNTGIQQIKTLNVSHLSKIYNIRYNLLYKVVSENVRKIQEYEIILKRRSPINNSEHDKSLFIYKDNKMVFLWHSEIRKFKNLMIPLTSSTIDVVYWIHKINYYTDMANDQIIQTIYPGYNHASFVNLFFQYLGMDDIELNGKIHLSRYDILTVYLEKAWLNDQVINKYFELIRIRDNTDKKDKTRSINNIHIFDTFFFTTFLTHGYERVQNYTKKIDIFSFKKLLIPVNICQHWMVIGYDVESKNIFFYDSISVGRENRILAILSKVTDYLYCEHWAKKGSDINISELTYFDGRSPQQNNNCDCGVYTCINGELFSRNAPSNNYNCTHINLYRQKIVFELLNRKFLKN